MLQDNSVVKLENKEKLDTVSIWELMGNRFYVPDYQRGYRWTKTEVIKLLEDLKEYIDGFSEGKGFYCMQPLVVYFNKEKDAWEVIDGQQRLTTLFLIICSDSDVLRRIKKNNTEIFKLTYECRPGCEKFLDPCFSSDENNIQQYIRLLSEGENQDESTRVEKFPLRIANVDYYHICNSLSTIRQFFDDKDCFDSEEFVVSIVNIMNNRKKPIIRFIWYDVTKEIEEGKIESEEVFSRLNVGKISLTNAELIKALFINRVDRELDSIKDDKVRVQISEPLKTKIANDWDYIEHSLLNADFWAFIYGEDDNYYDTRIEFLFDLIQKKSKDDEEYYTFDRYVSDFKEAESTKVVMQRWKDITDRYYLYKNWYENKNLYHLIGFLRYKGIHIKTITEIQSISSSNSDFVKNLRRLCVKLALSEPKELYDFNSIEFIQEKELRDDYAQFVNDKLASFDYDETYVQIRDTLLLFNILSSLDCEKESIRFSFKDYYSEHWDVEHICSKTDKGLSGVDRVDWILTNLGYFSGIPFPFEKKMKKTEKNQCISKMIKQIENSLMVLSKQQVLSPTKKYANGLSAGEIVEGLLRLIKDEKESINLESSDAYIMIKDVINETNPVFNKNSISNLVLLDQGTNRGYKNAYFPVKRKWIFSREKEGVYILPCTKNAFLKAYSAKLFDLMNWSQDDANYYMEEIKRCLTNI